MTLEEMLADLPTACDTGGEAECAGASGEQERVQAAHRRARRGLPVSCLLTSSLPLDSQAAIPLAQLTAGRVDSLYDLMDSAYHA